MEARIGGIFVVHDLVFPPVDIKGVMVINIKRTYLGKMKYSAILVMERQKKAKERQVMGCDEEGGGEGGRGRRRWSW